MTNVRTRLAAIEAGRNKGHGLVGLCKRMQERDRAIAAGEYVPDLTGPVDPLSLAGRMRAQGERNAAREQAAGIGDAA